MNTKLLSSIPTAAAGGAKQGSGLRRIVCLAALLVVFVSGARAIGSYNRTIYDGMTYDKKDSVVLLAFEKEGIIRSATSDDGITTFTTTDGKVLVSYKSGEGIFMVPTDVTPDDNLSLNVSKLKTSTTSFLQKNGISIATYSHLRLLFFVAVNEQNFPDENFRKWVLAEEYGSDSLLTKDEIAEVTSISVYNMSVASLKGIEYFTALTFLSCDNNQLTTLDISQNTALTYLSCNNNQLSVLDLSNNTVLATLFCNNNQLTALDVSNTKLKLIACYNNQLRGLGMNNFVQSLPQVGTGVVEVCSESDTEGNEITTIQVQAAKDKGWKVRTSSGNDYEGVAPGIAINDTNFPDYEFRKYVLNNCDTDKDTYLSDEEIAKVTKIDVMNSICEDLKGIESFTALTSLDCSGNYLTALDVSQNTALTSLVCDGNHLTALDVSQNTALKQLWCSQNMLTSLDVSQNTALITLSCSFNHLTALDVSQNSALRQLGCCRNQIRGEKMAALVNSLPEVTNGRFLVYIDSETEGNEITSVQVKNAKDKGWNVLTGTGDEYSGIIVPGDANGDGEVNTLDVDCLRGYILGLDPKPFSLESADMDESGTADIVDLARLIEKLKE